MHLYAASSSQIQECWYHRVTPTYSFMTTLHVSYKGQRSFVHTQLSQLQSFQYLGKAVTMWNTRRDCRAQSPNYLLWNYFYPPNLVLGPFYTEWQRQSSGLLTDSNTSSAESSSGACLGLHKPLCFPPRPKELLHHWKDINKDQPLAAHSLPQGTQRLFSALHVCPQF